MKLKDWNKEEKWISDYDYKQEYKSLCTNCNKEHKLRTQEDNYPEYYTYIFIECNCGDYVHFRLPVN